MTPQELRQSILNLAFQGKLLSHNSNVILEDADEVCTEIKKEIEILIDTGLLKKGKGTIAIDDNEVPFSIPSNWKWMRFGELSQLLDGKKTTGKEYPYLEAKYLRGKSPATYLKAGKFVTSGTKAILVDGENSGEVFDINEDGYLGSTFKVLFYSSKMFEEYILFFLLFHKNDYRNNKKGSAIPHLNKDLFFNMPTPIPPYNEQIQIVNKIKQCFQIVEKYEKYWLELEKLNKDFSNDLQKSIIQYAIMGKLLEQLPEEGTGEDLYKLIQAEKNLLIKDKKIKKEKPLPDVLEDEIPFDIPDSWKWVRLGDVSSYEQTKQKISAKDIKPEMWSIDLEDIEKDTGKIIRYCKASERKISGDKICFSKGQILYSKLRPYLKKILISTSDGICTPELIPFNVYGGISPQYFVYVLKSPYVDYVINSVTYGVKMPRVGTETMTNLLIPLPPIKEQERIVNKIDELLILCDKLKQGD